MIGQLHSFNVQDDFTMYKEIMDNYFIANKITDENRKRAIFLSSVGLPAYKKLRDLCLPDMPNSKSYNDLCKLLQEHIQPKPSESIQRFKFNMATRNPGEPISAYTTRLRALAEHCNFGDGLEVALRDRLVCGILDTNIQKRLLAEKNLTFNQAYELALGLEVASKNVSLINETSAVGVNKIGHQNNSHNHRQKKFKSDSYACNRCGGIDHKINNCRHKDTICNYCRKKGHLAKVCFKRKNDQDHNSRTNSNTNRKIGSIVKTVETDSSTATDICDHTDLFKGFTIGSVTSGVHDYQSPIRISAKCDDVNITFELDTGASFSLINEHLFRTHWNEERLEKSDISLFSYTGEQIPVVGLFYPLVQYNAGGGDSPTNGTEVQLPLLVVKGNGKPLWGRNWLHKIKLNWSVINQVQTKTKASEITGKYSHVFGKGCGTYTGESIKLHLDPTVQPKYFKARNVPYALREKVLEEIDRLVHEGIIEPVQFSNWATPCVPVLKSDSTIRLCGDYSRTTNLALKDESYPLPKIEDIFARLAGGKLFTKIDLSQAYQQLLLHPDSRECTTINTLKGLFQYRRLPYGLNQCPSLFQRIIDNLLLDCPGTTCYLDDILVTGKSLEDHYANLEQVLQKLSDAGFRANLEKCVFFSKSVEYLGHVIDANGLHASRKKTLAICNAPKPTDVSQVRAFCGMMQYYHKFCKNLSQILVPLYELLGSKSAWNWTERHDKAFEECKKMLDSPPILVHYDPDLPIQVTCDASSYGLGSVISHKMTDGTIRPIAFASRTLHPAERNYSQVEKEALACIFAVTRFHQYLYGRKFQLVTDHKPLLGLLQKWKQVPEQASPRMVRWSLKLQAYDYELIYMPGQQIANADGLSRLPIKVSFPTKIPTVEEYEISSIACSPGSIVSSTDVHKASGKDTTIATAMRYTLHGWPGKVSTDLEPYFRRREELSVEKGCLFLGFRMVIPTVLRPKILYTLHEGHPGISRMKALGRSYVWWPGFDNDVETRVRTCDACQEVQPKQQKAPLHPWEYPSTPWSRIHVDYKGPVDGKLYLVIIDAHSKWVEVLPTKFATSTTTIKLLQKVFVQHGLPKSLVSDNGTCFASVEFKTYMDSLGIKHIFSAPFHPSTNGQAERAVQNLKKALQKAKASGESIDDALAKFLFSYRITPSVVTGYTPAELLNGRKLRSKLDLLYPDVSERVGGSQEMSVQRNMGKARSFQVGEKVYVESFSTLSNRWIEGEITESSGPVSYKIKLNSGKIIRRHIDHIRVGKPHTPESKGDIPNSFDAVARDFHFQEIPKSEALVPQSTQADSLLHDQAPVRTTTERERYPKRNVKNPDWLIPHGSCPP